MKVKLEELSVFLGAYFHQDWLMEHGSAEEVISAFLAESNIEILRLIQQEIKLLLSDQKGELNLRDYLLNQLSCYYCYWNEWNTAERWLLHIASRLNLRINHLDRPK